MIEYNFSFPPPFDKIVEGIQCAYCEKQTLKEEVRGFGLCKSEQDNGKIVFFLDCECKDCDKRFSAEIFGLEFEDYLEMLNKLHQTYLAKDKKKGESSSGKIPDEEWENFKKILEKSETHYDFMKMIGMNPSENSDNDEGKGDKNVTK
jgi:hypothetical protein